MQLSSVARSLSASGAAAPDSTLEPERLRSLLDRISNRYYDRPEVLDAVARRVLPELIGH